MALAGKYVFGDFVRGRLWALDLTDEVKPATAHAFGQWPVLPTTFARDASGEVYFADFASSSLFRIDPP